MSWPKCARVRNDKFTLLSGVLWCNPQFQPNWMVRIFSADARASLLVPNSDPNSFIWCSSSKCQQLDCGEFIWLVKKDCGHGFSHDRNEMHFHRPQVTGFQPLSSPLPAARAHCCATPQQTGVPFSIDTPGSRATGARPVRSVLNSWFPFGY